MTINRRRAPSSAISSEKKLSGHTQEDVYASLLGGVVLDGTQKGDVKDKYGKLYSVKSGKKWQVFLYGYNRIHNSFYLNILQPCLNAFPEDSEQYFQDRIKCITFKEDYVKKYGKEATRELPNTFVEDHLGSNTYIESKNQLAITTNSVCNKLKDKVLLRNFLNEALFNNAEVEFLVIKDTTYEKDGLFKVFSRDDVLEILTSNLYPSVSTAGSVPEDYNVANQKTLLRYQKNINQQKNIVEIEIRNDSDKHYRQVRFNMYSKDTLFLLLNSPKCFLVKYLCEQVAVYGKAVEAFHL